MVGPLPPFDHPFSGVYRCHLGEVNLEMRLSWLGKKVMAESVNMYHCFCLQEVVQVAWLAPKDHSFKTGVFQ